MALTEFQRDVCRVIARQRITTGESYVAGGAALNLVTGSPRVSKDIDIFHDALEAVTTSAEEDAKTLSETGYDVSPLIVRFGMAQATVSKGEDAVELQWTTDSAWRFFPLMEHPALGLTLHPFDLATNKTLAMVGRRAVRDWYDLIGCQETIQPLGYLAWAAAGKDPGFNPASILEYAARARYQQSEVDELKFIDGATRDVAGLSRHWHRMVDEAREIVQAIPIEEYGKCVMTASGELYKGTVSEIEAAYLQGNLRFHAGSLRGAFPQIKEN